MNAIHLKSETLCESPKMLNEYDKMNELGNAPAPMKFEKEPIVDYP